jgi:hypothetical protein
VVGDKAMTNRTRTKTIPLCEWEAIEKDRERLDKLLLLSESTRDDVDKIRVVKVRKLENRECAICGNQMEISPVGFRKNRRYCSDACRQKAWRERHRG